LPAKSARTNVEARPADGRAAGVESSRRDEILDLASQLVASSGLATSVKDIADACGILPGSLYHHFESKEAILIELVRRYQADLERIADEALDVPIAPIDRDVRSIDDRIVTLGEAIASCAVRHRAALLVTLYEPPRDAGAELARLARRTPTAIRHAMTEILRQGRAAGVVRSGIDLDLVADRLCQSMLHHGVGDSARVPGGDRTPALRCRIVLEGLATVAPDPITLDMSDARQVAVDVVAEWEDDADDDRRAQIRRAARAEFARRGYDVTTMRDVAAAAGLGVGTVYRVYASKDDLLLAVMASYTEKWRTGWNAVLDAASSPVEKLDALAWVNAHLMDRFADEFAIQLGWLRQSPPVVRKLGSTDAQRRAIRELLTTGVARGELRMEHGPVSLYVRCVYEALWTPENIVRAAGVDGAHALAREMLLVGVHERPRVG
jgi:AcrR family transcriptional regulator